MRSSSRGLVAGLVCVLAGLAGLPGWQAGALAEESPSSSGGSSLSGNPLVVGGEEVLVGGQRIAAEEAKRASPEAVAARASSETAYRGLDSTSANAVAKTYFPDLFSQTDGGLPSSVAEHVSRYVGPYAAELSEANGKRDILESSQPVAQEVSAGGWSPVGLGVRATNGAFEAESPIVQVRASERLDQGVQLPGLGVTVVPLASPGGSASSAQGVADGSAVFFGNTQTDTDTVFKPSTFGFALDSVLRSSDSPSVLSFHIGLPAHTRLVGATNGIDIVREGAVIAQVSSPTARDAAGRAVSVKMTVSGTELTLEVYHGVGETQYPIYVDPEYNVISESLTVGNWHYGQSEGFTFENGGSQLRALHAGKTYPAGDYGYWATETPGSAWIYKEEIKDVLEPTNPYEVNTYPYYSAWANIEGHGETVLSGSPYTKSTTVCSTECNGHYFIFEVASLESSQAAKEKEHLSEAYYYGGTLTSATTYIDQAKEIHSTVLYYTEQPSIEYTHEGKNVSADNVLYGSTKWLGPNAGAFKYKASDTGLGVAVTSIEVYKAGKWELARSKNYLTEEGGCIGVRCSSSQQEVVTWPMISGHLENGRDKIRVAAHDPMAGTSSSEHGEGEASLNVDNEAPHNLTISGLAVKGEEYELGEVEANIRVEATDGSGTTASSGISGLAIEIDGKQIGWPAGSCAEGPCSASAEWPINGAELGVGSHTLTVVANDKAGNVASKNVVLNVYHASPLAMGPGSVNPESGDFALEATDVNLSGGMGPLTVSRHYDSRNLTEGASGPLGPQWSISLGSLASLEVLPDESVMIVDPDGLTHFTKKEGKFEAPEGDSSLTLEYKTGEYLLSNKDKGTTTRFTLPSGATTWMPTTSTSPVATDTTTDEYETVEPEAGQKIVEPTLELAPRPSTTCVHNKHEIKWEAGCRGLTFVYETATTATGENPAEWGEYKGRLKEVIALVYSPTTKKLQEPEPVVAKYEYDAHGRLRAEWDPRITPALKTTYGYDAEGHITALTGPGQQPWAFTYGTISNDPSLGRLIKATHAQPATGATKEQIENTLREQTTQAKTPEAPKITGSPIVGTRLAVSTGKWTGSPVNYGYQWEDCYFHLCGQIAGATNANYTPQRSDIGYGLAVRVTATNSDGTVSIEVPETSVVLGAAPPVYSSEIKTAGGSELKTPRDVAVDAKGNVWVADSNNARIIEFNEKGEFLRSAGKEGTGPGEFGWPNAITTDAKGNVWVTDPGRHRVEKFNEKGEYVRQFGEWGISHEKGQFNEGLYGIAVDPKEDVWVAADDYVEEFNEKGEYVTEFGGRNEEAGHGYFFNIMGLAIDGKGNFWVSEDGRSGENRGVQELNERHEWIREFGSKGVGLKGELGWGVSYIKRGNGGNVWVAATYRDITEFNERGEFVTEVKASGLEPEAGGVDAKGDVWVSGNPHVLQKWVPGTPTEGEYQAPQPGSTIEYNVPVSGTGAPHEMTASEVGKWGEKDDPAVATAIFPPDEPQSWPATQYKRATTIYMDSQARTVNVASPSGGIATSEYGEGNNMVRTLSPANRATALKEGNPAESAKLLDTESKYAKEGTELVETTGPQHTVKLASGSVVQARNHVKYSYDEGAPEGEEHGLVTKTVGSALVGGKEEEARTTKTYYSGQENLGWKLREPTSVTVDPGGLNLSHTTVYEPSTGNVIEKRSPVGSAGHEPAPLYSSQFGSKGEGNGQFFGPVDAALDSHGNVWVTDYGNGRIEEFSSTGTFMATHGSWGSGNGQFEGAGGIAINQTTGNVYASDVRKNRIEEFSSTGTFIRAFGSYGEGSGQFNTPVGVAIDSSGNVWAADLGNDRIEEFSSEGAFVAAYGSYGSGDGQFRGPSGLAFSGGHLYVTDSSNNRVEEFSTAGSYVAQFGTSGTGNGQFKLPWAIATDPRNGNLDVIDYVNSRVEQFSSSGTFLVTFGYAGTGPGQLDGAEGLTVSSTGTVYIVNDENDHVQIWTPVNIKVHDTKTIYYTAKGEAEVSTCQNHPEWVNLVCESLPVAQPETGGLPSLPVTTIKAYNVWNEPEVVTETFGSTTRTKHTSFDPAGRALASEVTAGIDTSVSAVTDKYDEKTGALVEEGNTVAGKTKTIKSVFNTLGQLTAYTDADENTTKYEYEGEGSYKGAKELDMRLRHVADGKGAQTYTYDETTGFMTKLEDSAAGTFTTNRDVAGRITSETYPNAMTASDTYNSVGEATSIRYEKTAHCATTCPETWFKETISPSIHGEALERANTLTTDAYAYDPAGRLTQVQETPAGKGCVTRLYGYDEESNRTSLTSRSPGAEGKCATEGGTTENHQYDPVNRLIDSGVSCETFGNTTKLPGADAGGPEMEINTEYYVDNQVASQTQNGKTYKYYMDPAGRVRETKTEVGGKATAEVLSHYAGPGSALAWTSEEEGKTWTRNIPGIDGSLTAIQSSSGTITLQLHDLQGNVVETASDLETQTKILTSYNSTEFGAPLNGPPPTKYSWLGATGVSSEQSSGLVTQDGVTYVPQTGRPLQTQGTAPPIPDNAATAYISTIEAGIDAAAAAASAQQVANAEQARKALEGAGEAIGAEGSAALEGSEMLEGGCSGGNACTASGNYCERHWRFGEPVGGVLWVAVGVKCNRKVSGIEVEACLWAWTGNGSKEDNKNYGQFVCSGPHEKGQAFHNTSEAATLMQEVCSTGWGYKAWVWGRAWGTNFWFEGRGLVSPTWICKDAPYGFESEFTELFLSK